MMGGICSVDMVAGSSSQGKRIRDRCALAQVQMFQAPETHKRRATVHISVAQQGEAPPSVFGTERCLGMAFGVSSDQWGFGHKMLAETPPDGDGIYTCSRSGRQRE